MALLNSKQAAEYLGMSKSWLDHKRANGLGPEVVRLGHKAMYRPEDLDTFILEMRELAK